MDGFSSSYTRVHDHPSKRHCRRRSDRQLEEFQSSDVREVAAFMSRGCESSLPRERDDSFGVIDCDEGSSLMRESIEEELRNPETVEAVRHFLRKRKEVYFCNRDSLSNLDSSHVQGVEQYRLDQSTDGVCALNEAMPVRERVNSTCENDIEEVSSTETQSRAVNPADSDVHCENNSETRPRNVAGTKSFQFETWKQRWARLCLAELPFLDSFFNKHVVQLLLPGAVMKTLGNSVTDIDKNISREDILGNVALFLAGLKFSRAPGEPKSKWSHGSGRIQLEFRLFVGASVLNYVACNSERIISEFGTTCTSVPGWLSSGFVSVNDIRLAIRRMHTISSHNRRIRSGRNPSTKDLSEYVSEYLLKEIGSLMIASRRRMMYTFFGQIGYTMVKWAEYPISINGQEYVIDQRTMDLDFGIDTVSSELELSAMPLTEISDRTTSNSVIDKYNIARHNKVKQMISSYEVVVKHNVAFSRNSTICEESCTRRISFFSLAWLLLGNFSCTSDRLLLMRTSKHSLRVVASFAVLMYRMVKYFHFERMTNDNASMESVSIGPLTLKSFMPSAYRIKRGLQASGVLLRDARK